MSDDLQFPKSGTISIISNARHVTPVPFGVHGIYMAVFANEVWICDTISGLSKIYTRLPMCGSFHMFPTSANSNTKSLRIELKNPLSDSPQFSNGDIIPMDDYKYDSKQDKNFIPVRVCLDKEKNIINIEISNKESLDLLPKEVQEKSLIWFLPRQGAVYGKF